MATPNYATSNLFNIQGLVVVITGGGSGLGQAMARALATNGAKTVYIIGRRKDMLEQTASTHSDIIKPLVADVTSKESLASAAQTISQQTPYIDVLIANSGILGPKTREMGLPTEREATLEEWRMAMWDGASMDAFTNTYHVNVTGAFYTILAFLGLLDEGNKRRRKVEEVVEGGMAKSQIIITSSIAGFSRQPAAGFAYSTTKAGVTHLTKILSTKFAHWDVRVNGIAPGMFPSEMNPSGVQKKAEDTVAPSAVPLRRFGTEEEMAGVVMFLVGPSGGYVNGEVLVVDGGRLSQVPAVY